MTSTNLRNGAYIIPSSEFYTNVQYEGKLSFRFGREEVI